MSEKIPARPVSGAPAGDTDAVDDKSRPRRVLLAGLVQAPEPGLVAVVKQGGWPAARAGSMSRALEMIREQKPDVLLIDAGVGGESPAEWLRALPETGAAGKMSVVLLLDRANLGYMLAGLREGADAALVKPLRFERLAECCGR